MYGFEVIINPKRSVLWGGVWEELKNKGVSEVHSMWRSHYMLPEKGSASEGSAVFCGDVYRSVCFAWFGLLVWLIYYRRRSKGQALKKRTKYYTKKQNLSHEYFCDFYQKENHFFCDLFNYDLKGWISRNRQTSSIWGLRSNILNFNLLIPHEIKFWLICYKPRQSKVPKKMKLFYCLVFETFETWFGNVGQNQIPNIAQI